MSAEQGIAHLERSLEVAASVLPEGHAVTHAIQRLLDDARAAALPADWLRRIGEVRVAAILMSLPTELGEAQEELTGTLHFHANLTDLASPYPGTKPNPDLWGKLLPRPGPLWAAWQRSAAASAPAEQPAGPARTVSGGALAEAAAGPGYEGGS